MSDVKFKKVHDFLWEIPKENKMKVPGRIYASKPMLDKIRQDNSPLQVQNVSQLPGIVSFSMAMPDIHWGYGFPIGGVAAFDLNNGVISPGGVGYDINCGVRLLKTALTRADIQNKIQDLVNALFSYIPTGVGSKGDFKVNEKNLKQVMVRGAKWIVEQGYGEEQDLEKIEERGQMEGADPSTISDKAIKRGLPQLGTLGSGNHFVEIQYVEETYDDQLAQRLGLFPGQITVSIHTGSRGFGYQICDDYIRTMIQASQKYGIELTDRQLCCAPVNSPEGQQYFAAMVCAVNYAFANRQVISYWVKEAFVRALNLNPKQVQFDTVYEVAHNIAKIETHAIEGKQRRFCVHRKGATRAFGPGRIELPEIYRDIGQPVLIPGDMGRCSYVLIGTETAMEQTFGSTCHGAGRLLSRNQAIKAAKGRAIHRELEDQGIIVRAASRGTMAEEMPEAYKDVSEVVAAVVGAGISKKVAKLKPMGVIKG